MFNLTWIRHPDPLGTKNRGFGSLAVLTEEDGVPGEYLDGCLNDGIHLCELASHLRMVGSVLVARVVHAQEMRHKHIPLS